MGQEKKQRVNITTPSKNLDDILSQLSIVKNKNSQITIKARNIELSESDKQVLKETGKRITVISNTEKIEINKEHEYSEKKVRKMKIEENEKMDFKGFNLITSNIPSSSKIEVSGLTILTGKIEGLIIFKEGTIILKNENFEGRIQIEGIEITNLIETLMEEKTELIYLHKSEDGLTYELI